jgi:hypothetical protein
MDHETVLGIVYNASTMTIATRHGRRFDAIQQQAPVASGEALARILELANKYRHHTPMFHLYGDGVPTILDTLRRANVLCSHFQFFAPVNDAFANYGSRQFSELKEQVTTGLRAGVLDDALVQELDAFKRDETGGKVRYPSPEAVAPELGHYPGRAASLLLANQYGAMPATQFRPLASSYVPVQHRAADHDPFAVATLGHEPY